VLTVTAGATALEAIAIMRRHGVSAIAVVAADTGALRGAFSLGALRRIMTAQFSALALPVGDFMALNDSGDAVPGAPRPGTCPSL
jgi:CBS domain-containing protein